MIAEKRGFVALLDVLGFSHLVQQDPEAHGLASYTDTVVHITSPYRGMKTILFSDTVVLFTFDDSSAAFQNITTAVSRLLFALLKADIPIRGAVAHGAFVRSEASGHGTVIAGHPIIEAHYFESRLQWVGVMLAPSTLKHIGPLKGRTEISPIRDGETPDAFFKRSLKAARVQPCNCIPVQEPGSGSMGRLEGYAVVPISTDTRTAREIRESVKRAVDKLLWLRQLGPEPRSQAKYQNAIEWLSTLHTDWIPVLR